MAHFGSYDAVEEIGRGGMGRVLRAIHRPTGAVRAIKVMDGAVDADGLARFQREIETLARAGGEGVVAIHECGQEGGSFWYSMDLLGGGSLKARLRQRGRLPWKEAAAVVAKLARALDRCHALGIVHRDLKPDNVLFDDRGEPLLADFGLVRDLHAKTLTKTNEWQGTPAYMAPEQLQAKKVGGAADVWSLGVLLYELIAGVRPHAGTTYQEILDAARGAKRRRLATVATIPADVDALVERALSPEPARRPTAASFASELERSARGEPERRSRAPIVAGVVALAAVSIIIIIFVPGKPAPPPAAEPGKLDTLERAAAALSSPRHEEALAFVRGELDAGLSRADAAIAALGSAIAASPSDLELRRLRLRAALARSRPIAGDDLAALARADDPAVEDLARRASSADPATLGALAELRAARPTSRPIAQLFGLTALRSGDVRLRADAEHAFEVARAPGGVAREMAAGLAAVDSLANAFARPPERFDPTDEAKLEGQNVAAALSRLVKDEPVAAGVILAPFIARGRERVRARRLPGLQSRMPSAAADAVLTAFPLDARDRAILPAIAVGESLREIPHEVEDLTAIEPARIARLELAARGLRGDPLLAATALELAARNAFSAFRRSERRRDDAMVVLATFEEAARLVDGYSSSQALDVLWARDVLHRCRYREAEIEALVAGNPPERTAWLERALAHRKEALAISLALEDGLGFQDSEIDAREVCRVLYGLGRADETLAYVPRLTTNEKAIVQGEAARRAGRLDEAAAMVEPVLRSQGPDLARRDAASVLALIEADRGNVDRARELVASLPPGWKALVEMTKRELEHYVERKARR